MSLPSSLRCAPPCRLPLAALLLGGALAGCYGDSLPGSAAAPVPTPGSNPLPVPAPGPTPSPSPSPVSNAPLPKVIRCAPGTTITAAAEGKTQVADCHAAATGASS